MKDKSTKTKKSFSRIPTKLQRYLKDNKISQQKIAANTFQSVRTVSQVCRKAEGTTASKELIRHYLKLDKETFYGFLGEPVPEVKLVK